MARIRSIKPEFPHSESMGRVSRDARLVFIMLWTIADDSGRLRGNSRMLASLLFPYDDDANGGIERWLCELEREGCIVRYKIGSDSFLEICNWLEHQKIDKPSKSKIPSFEESSRILANPREVSSEDQRKGSKDQGEDQGKEREENLAATPPAPRVPHKRKRRSAEEILSPYPEGVKQVVSELLPEWPEFHDPAKEKRIAFNRAAFAQRVSEILDSNREATPDLLIAAGKEYLAHDGNAGWFKGPEFFFGPQGPWLAIVRDLLTRNTLLQVTA